jgi:hypothetical protein
LDRCRANIAQPDPKQKSSRLTCRKLDIEGRSISSSRQAENDSAARAAAQARCSPEIAFGLWLAGLALPSHPSSGRTDSNPELLGWPIAGQPGGQNRRNHPLPKI